MYLPCIGDSGSFCSHPPDDAVLSSVTILMGLGFFFMARKRIWVPCIILAVVWVLHMVYFLFFVKTISSEEAIKKE